MKPVQRTSAEVMDELKRFVADWKSTHRLVPAEVGTMLSMVASDYAQTAYVDRKIYLGKQPNN